MTGVWCITGLQPPAGRVDWFLENMPGMLAGAVLLFTGRGFRFSRWVYGCFFLHAIILAYGGYYTYAEAPVGFWLRDALHLARNHYDRFGHLAQGFFPSFVAREIYIRRSPLKRGFALFFATLSCVLALSACYELLEGITAHFVTTSVGDAFLGTQGDVWDTQWDMFCALCGGLVAQLPWLTRAHSRSIAVVTGHVVESPASGGRLA
jgi:putative membrane protein